MAADMLDLGSGLSSRAEGSPFEKGHLQAEASSCTNAAGLQQLQQPQQQQQNPSDTEGCPGYACLLLSNTTHPPAPLLWVGVGAGGAGTTSRNPLYPPAGSTDSAAATFGDCSKLVQLPLHSLTSFSTEASTPPHAQLVQHAAASDGGGTATSGIHTPGAFCSPAGLIRSAVSGLKGITAPAAAAAAGGGEAQTPRTPGAERFYCRIRLLFCPLCLHEAREA